MTATAMDRARRDIEALAARATDTHALRELAMERLERVVPVDGWCASTADPASLVMTTNVTRGVDRGGAPVLFHNEYAQRDVGKHAVLARAPSPVAVLSRATGGALERSPRYRELLRPMGLEHELRAAARAGGRTWGFVHLFRARDRPDFTADEADFAARVSATIAAGIRRIVLERTAEAVPATAAPGLLLLDAAGRPVDATPGNAAWLEALRDPDDPDAAVPEVLITLAAWARALGGAAGPQAARARVPGLDGGWWTLHASRTVNGAVAIIAQPATPAELVPVLLGLFGLTRGEQEVTEHVLEGRSTKEIAAALHLSPYTVQDRLKGVFDKVGVRSRRELVARLHR